MHIHDSCDHSLKYCAHCDVVYCTKCHREWGHQSWSYWKYPTWSTNQFLCSTTGNADTTTTCAHS